MALQQSGSEAATPLFIAVTGHRTLAAEHQERVAAEIRHALVDLQARVPHTPIRIVSGLAEGADTIVTQIGLDLGMEVEAVVAAPLERYRSGLTVAARHDFDSILRLPDV